jgi:hypothetical protein
MWIDINYQSLAQKIKYKAISNSLRKEKRISLRSHHCAACVGVAHSEVAHDGEARACWRVLQKIPCTNRESHDH